MCTDLSVKKKKTFSKGHGLLIILSQKPMGRTLLGIIEWPTRPSDSGGAKGQVLCPKMAPYSLYSALLLTRPSDQNKFTIKRVIGCRLGCKPSILTRNQTPRIPWPFFKIRYIIHQDRR